MLIGPNWGWAPLPGPVRVWHVRVQGSSLSPPLGCVPGPPSPMGTVGFRRPTKALAVQVSGWAVVCSGAGGVPPAVCITHCQAGHNANNTCRSVCIWHGQFTWHWHGETSGSAFVRGPTVWGAMCYWVPVWGHSHPPGLICCLGRGGLRSSTPPSVQTGPAHPAPPNSYHHAPRSTSSSINVSAAKAVHAWS